MVRSKKDGKRQTYAIVFALVAMFILGSITTLFAMAESSETCDWDRSASKDIFREAANGAATAEVALKELTTSSNELTVPAAAVTNRSGPERYEVRGVDPEFGHVAYAVYVNDTERINATVSKFPDGTYGLTHFITCLGV